MLGARTLQFAFYMLKVIFPLLLAVSSPYSLADRISCANYLLNYALRTQATPSDRLEPWLSRLRDAGLGELSALVEQNKVMVRERDSVLVKSVNWRTTLVRGRDSRGYMILLNPLAIEDESDSFWKFANALYEIYFFRSLWGIPPDFWDNENLGSHSLTSRAPKYFESLRRITPRMYALYAVLEDLERAKLPRRQVNEPSVLAQTTRIWSAPVDNHLNQRDFETFSRDGEARLNEVLRNRLEARVVIGHYGSFARKALLVNTIFWSIMATVHLPAQIHTAQMLAGPIFQQVKSLNSNDSDERYINGMRVSLKREQLRKEELLAKTSLTPEEKQTLKEIEDEIEAILSDLPELRNK